MPFQTVSDKVTAEMIEKKSRFVAVAFPASNISEFQCTLKAIKKDHKNARHFCYAYRIIDNENSLIRVSDDGEPASTAGKPIFNQLEGNDLYNVAIVVVRYFGGIKLGAGGLTRAYGGAAKLAIQEAQVCPYRDVQQFEIELTYENYASFEKILEKYPKARFEADFLEGVTYRVSCTREEWQDIIKLFQ